MPSIKFEYEDERKLREFLNDDKVSSEAVVRRCSLKKVFLEISQNSQKNTCARDSSLIKLQSLQIY